MNQPIPIFLMTDLQRVDTVEAGSPCQTPNLVTLPTPGTSP
jgi:hypothetical protein